MYSIFPRKFTKNNEIQIIKRNFDKRNRDHQKIVIIVRRTIELCSSVLNVILT